MCSYVSETSAILTFHFSLKFTYGLLKDISVVFFVMIYVPKITLYVISMYFITTFEVKIKRELVNAV